MIRPPNLLKGDKVSIVAPAGRVRKNELKSATGILNDWGLEVVIGQHAFDNHGFFSSRDGGRLHDLQLTIDDPSVKAIFCARGGFGTGRILDRLNFEALNQNPKWIIGFSDITLLHLQLHRLGILSIHGMVARQLNENSDLESVTSLKQILFGNEEVKYAIPPFSMNRVGEAAGQILGGNLTLLCNNIGTSTDTSFDNKILFVEDTNEYLYAIDRHFNQLERSGKLAGLAGCILGQFTNTKDTTPSYGKSVNDIINDYLAPYDFPVCYGFSIGHNNRNLAVPYSANTILTVGREEVLLRFD